MRTLVMLAVLFVPLFAFGDDLVLRDGRRLPWKSLMDEGESYTVETKDGKKLSIKKSDVERIAMGDPGAAAGPLTGASFTLGPKVATTDLILKVQTGGGWKSVGRTLNVQATWPVREVAPVDFEPIPEEYDLTLVVERVGGGDKDFAVGIVAGGSICAYHFDAWDGTKSVLAMIGGQEGEAVAGRVFQSGKPRTVKVQVRKDAVAITLDGKDFWKSRMDWKLVAPHSSITLKGKRLFLVAAGGSWKVLAYSITAVAEK